MFRHATTPLELTIPSPPAHAILTPRRQMFAFRSASKWLRAHVSLRAEAAMEDEDAELGVDVGAGGEVVGVLVHECAVGDVEIADRRDRDRERAADGERRRRELPRRDVL